MGWDDGFGLFPIVENFPTKQLIDVIEYFALVGNLCDLAPMSGSDSM
jgi:hypothetical protein